MNTYKKVILGSVFALAASNANAFFEPFTVDETVVPGAGVLGAPGFPGQFEATAINLRYEAIINQANDGSGPLNGDGFIEVGFIDFGPFFNGPTGADPIMDPPGSLLDSANSIGGYDLYGLFTLTGTSTFNGSIITASFLTGTLDIFLDPDKDTVPGLSIAAPAVADGTTGAIVSTSGSTADDLLVGSASIVQAGSEANLTGSLAGGDFDVIWNNFALTAFGSTYFSSPTGFYSSIDLNGNTDTVSPAGNVLTPFISTANGSGSASFQNVPEPNIVFLFGVGLIALGLKKKIA